MSANLLKYNPDIDEVIVWSRERFESHLRQGEFLKALALWRTLQANLANKYFYAVLDIHGLFLTGMISRLAHADRYIGMSDAKELNSFFMAHTAKPLSNHIVDKYLGVLESLGITPAHHQMTLVTPEAAQQFAIRYLANDPLTQRAKIAVLIPGTTWSSKTWPPIFFAETARLLAKDYYILLCGGKPEYELGLEIQRKSGIPLLNTIGTTTLLELAAIMQLASVVISGDTGPLFMAAALKIPTVAIFGPTDPAKYAPLGVQHIALHHRLACSFCHKHHCRTGDKICMNSITPTEVVQKVYDLISSPNPESNTQSIQKYENA